MKLVSIAAAACFFSSVALAQESPVGSWAMDKDATLAVLAENGKDDEKVKQMVEMLAASTVDFTEDTIQFMASPEVFLAKCGWEADDQGAIKIQNCVDKDGKPDAKNGPTSANWMEDDSLRLLGGHDMVLVYRRK